MADDRPGDQANRTDHSGKQIAKTHRSSPTVKVLKPLVVWKGRTGAATVALIAA